MTSVEALVPLQTVFVSMGEVSVARVCEELLVLVCFFFVGFFLLLLLVFFCPFNKRYRVSPICPRQGWSDPENPAPHPTVAEIDANHRLLSKPAVSIQVLRNGSHPLLPRLRGDDHARVVGEMVVGNSLIKVGWLWWSLEFGQCWTRGFTVPK